MYLNKVKLPFLDSISNERFYPSYKIYFVNFVLSGTIENWEWKFFLYKNKMGGGRDSFGITLLKSKGNKLYILCKLYSLILTNQMN